MTTLIVDELVGSLTAFEQWRKKKQQSLEEALQAKAKISKARKESKPENRQCNFGRGESSGGRSFGRNTRGRGRGREV